MTTKIYQSKINDATELGPSSAVLSGGEGVNMLNGLTFDCWKPDAVGNASCNADFDAGAAILVDYFAFDVHNLDAITFDDIKLIAATDAAFTTPVTLTTIATANIVDGANIKEFSNVTSYRYYKVEVNESANFTTAPIIGVMYIGEALALPSGIRPSYTPPRLGVVAEISNHTSEGGNFIGRSVRRMHYEFVIKNDYVTKAWIDANWNTLLEYIQLKPFFYLWNDIYDDEGVFCWTSGKIAPPRYVYQAWLSFEFRCNGFA